MRAGGMNSGNVSLHHAIRGDLARNLFKNVSKQKMTTGLANAVFGHSLGKTGLSPSTAPTTTARRDYGAENAMASVVNSAALSTPHNLQGYSDQNLHPEEDAEEKQSSSEAPSSPWDAVLGDVIQHTDGLNITNVVANPMDLDDSLNQENRPMLQRVMKATQDKQVVNWQREAPPTMR